MSLALMPHCGWFRAKDGTPIHAPRFPGPPAKLTDHAKVVAAWTVEHVFNSRPAHDPDHPFGTTIPCPCGL